ncbi:zeatin O-glucosyltransferase-like [Pyrus communis]|uniref:zeatin O-glucosyltransferase-like n=1 Tax=Pyrus communis TaxID=23211 RepID=UPI0035BFCDC3
MAHGDQHHQNQSQVVVVMVPLPAQGHLNQLLHLSRLISAYNIPVHYVGAATHNRQVKLRAHRWEAKLQFHDFPTPPFLSPPPNPNATNKFPSHLQPSFKATAHLRQPVAKLLRELSPKARRVIVIHDSMMASVIQDVASIPNGESYTFHSVSAFTIFLYLWEVIGMPKKLEELDVKLPNGIPSLEGCFTIEFMNFIGEQHEHQKLINAGNLHNTSRTIEGPYIDLLNRIGQQKHWAIGPFNPTTVANPNNNSNGSRHKCLEWLDKQEQSSVIYVSFGTTTAMKDEQIQELAIGLEESKQQFIWVLRDADKGDLFSDAEVRRAELPQGYEERVKGRGLVVRDWAPQLEILSHKSTGGFLSHCGWNSCIESITMGVPIAAWPMHSDQPRNTVLITKLLGVGFVMRDWDKRDELVTSQSIKNGVQKFMWSEEGDEIRKRAAELGADVRQSRVEGGASYMEFSSFIAHITRY